MKFIYPFSLVLAFLLTIRVHTHTDELPIVLGILLLLSAGVAAIFPQRFLLTTALLGAALFVAETLVHFRVLPAPYPVSAGLPWVALTGYVPAALGVALGTAIGAAGRRLA